MNSIQKIFGLHVEAFERRNIGTYKEGVFN